MRLFSDKNKRYAFLMGASILFGILYVLTGHMNYIMNMIEYRAFTLTNYVYAFLRFECIILPAHFFIGRNPWLPKIVFQKIFMVAFACAALSGVMWAFNYLNIYTFREMLNEEYMFLYQATTSKYIAVNRLMWGTTNLSGVILSLILAVMYFITGLVSHWHRKVVAVCFTVISVFRILSPIICICIIGEMEVMGEWFINNTFWLLSAIFMTWGLWCAAESDRTWLKYVWGEEQNLEFDDDED